MTNNTEKLWRVRAWTSADKKHCFAGCHVCAKTRKEAIEKALRREIESNPTNWNAGAGHIMTVSRLHNLEPA